MTEHKIAKEAGGYSGSGWRVTLTCSCGREIYGSGKRNNRSQDLDELKKFARRNAERAFRDHIPIR